MPTSAPRRGTKAAGLFFPAIAPASLAAAVLVLLAAPGGPAPGEAAGSSSPREWDRPNVSADTSWSGQILLRQNVVVASGAVLTVSPGTKVLVEPGRGIGVTVLGRLVVSGGPAAPVTFAPSMPGSGRGAWEGIRLGPGSPGDHTLSGVRVEGAREGVSLTETSATLSGAAFKECVAGIQVNQKARVAAERCDFEANEVGASLSLGGSGAFDRCRFDNIIGYGIAADKGSTFRIASSRFARGKTGILSLTNAPCRVEDSSFVSLDNGIVARQMGKDSAVSRCTFENAGVGIMAVQFSSIEIADSVFKGNRTGIDAREFSTPAVRHNRFEENDAAVSLFRKSHARIEGNLFVHNRNAVIVNYSSYPLIRGNNFDRNDMSVRLEKFQSGDWEERAGSPALTAGEAERRGSRAMPGGVQKTAFPKRVDARGNHWGPDADRDPAAGTLGKIWDGRKAAPVRYEGFGEESYRIDVVDFSEEAASPFPDAGPAPRSGPGGGPAGKAPSEEAK